MVRITIADVLSTEDLGDAPNFSSLGNFGDAPNIFSLHREKWKIGR